MLAYILAIASSVLYNSAIVLQSRDAAAAPPELEMRASLLWFLVRRRLWLAGTACLLAAVVLQTVALAHVSVDVMQSVTAAGILLLPLYGRFWLHQPMRGPELAAMVVLVAAVAVASLLVGTQEGALRGAGWQLAAGSAAVAVVPFVLARSLRDGSALAVVAGLGFSGVTVMQKELALAHGAAAITIAAAGFVACALAGFVAEMSALQTVSPMRVAPAVLGISTALPVLAAPALFGEHWQHPLPTFAALAVVVAASAYIARSAHAGVLAHEPA